CLTARRLARRFVHLLPEADISLHGVSQRHARPAENATIRSAQVLGVVEQSGLRMTPRHVDAYHLDQLPAEVPKLFPVAFRNTAVPATFLMPRPAKLRPYLGERDPADLAPPHSPFSSDQV